MKKLIGFFQKMIALFLLLNGGNVFAQTDCEGVFPMVVLEDVNICEGNSVIINISAYLATSYIWALDPDFTSISVGSNPIRMVKPDVTTKYYVKMEKDGCTKVDEILVTVNSNPRISRIDSIDLRTRDILLVEGYGTPPFVYSVDSHEFDSSPVKYDLFFGSHSAYVKDVIGCCSERFDFTVNIPQIFIPCMFSPNGDGINDTWEIAYMREVSKCRN